MRGTKIVGVLNPYPFDDVRAFKATITVMEVTDTIQVSVSPERIRTEQRTETTLTLTFLNMSYTNLFNLPDTTRESTLMSMNTEMFSSLLDSLQKNNVADQSHLLGRTFQFRDIPFPPR